MLLNQIMIIAEMSKGAQNFWSLLLGCCIVILVIAVLLYSYEKPQPERVVSPTKVDFDYWEGFVNDDNQSWPTLSSRDSLESGLNQLKLALETKKDEHFLKADEFFRATISDWLNTGWEDKAIEVCRQLMSDVG